MHRNSCSFADVLVITTATIIFVGLIYTGDMAAFGPHTASEPPVPPASSNIINEFSCDCGDGEILISVSAAQITRVVVKCVPR